MATSPAVMTFDSLSADVYNYSERPNDTALREQIPSLIMLAESECAADLKILGNELVVVSAFSPTNPVIAKPAFWRKNVSLTVRLANGERRSLFKRPYEYLRNFWPNPGLTEDPPRFYADYNYNNFFVAPTPATALQFELIYNARLDPLSSANQVNWLTANAPQLLLYSCMYHTSLYLKNFDKADNWKAQYTAALASLTAEDQQRVADRTTQED